MDYLPNANELSHERIQRDYLFTIINTLDPEFFPGAIAELEERKCKKIKQNQEQVVEVDAELLKAIENF